MVIIRLPKDRIMRKLSLFTAVDRTEIKAEFQRVLDSVVLVLNQYDKTGIDVAGHTDSTGRVEYNMELSERRAQSVRPRADRPGRELGAGRPHRPGSAPADREQRHRRWPRDEPARRADTVPADHGLMPSPASGASANCHGASGHPRP
jgi:hypothetical protein